MKKVRILILIQSILFCFGLNVGAVSIASAKKIIADIHLCHETTPGTIKCCSNTGKCPHTYSGCSKTTKKEYAGTWTCDSIEIRCKEKGSTNFSGCRFTRLTQKGPGSVTAKSSKSKKKKKKNKSKSKGR